MKGWVLRIRKLLSKQEYIQTLRNMGMSEGYLAHVDKDWHNTERDREVHGPYYELVKQEKTLMARNRYNLLDGSHAGGFAPGSRMARDGRLMPPVRRRLPLPLPTPMETAATLDAQLAPVLRAGPMETEATLATRLDPRLADVSPLFPPAMNVRRAPRRRIPVRSF